MNKKIALLDCTLRDGGFTNDWNFGFGTIQSLISRLDQAKVDIIEIGFIDQRRQYDNNKSIEPSTSGFAPILNGFNLSHSKIAAMIDYGTCDLQYIEDKDKTQIDIIRVIFKKKDIDQALLYCKSIKEKGYKVSVQPVSITSYTIDEFETLVEKINNIEPYCVSIVDTYGLMHNVEVSKYFKSLNKHLLSKIAIGFHSHNNFQMAYANCIMLMNKLFDRELVIDGSLFGMGKGAGNAPTELLAQYINENYNSNFDTSQLLEAIDVDIMKEYIKSPWGYSLKYFIAASADCHPNYVQTLMDKKSMSVTSINSILNMIPQNLKLSFNSELIETLYQNFHNNHIDDKHNYLNLFNEIKDKNLVILAPGSSLETQKDKITEYIKENKSTVISINFLNENFPVDYVFMGNPKRYSQFFHKMHGTNNKVKVICTSNITDSGFKIDYSFDFASLKLDKNLISDNPMLMLLKLLCNMNIKNVAIAGFDGYSSQNTLDYYGDYIQFLYCNDNVIKRNELIKEELKNLKNKLNINFISPTLYSK